MRNFQRDGHMRMAVPEGRVAYEPNSLAPGGPRENPRAGFTSLAATDGGPKVRLRAESFADHYSQARLFWKSMTPPEQGHIVSAFTFELGKVETRAVRQRMLGHLDVIHPDLGKRVAAGLGMKGEAEKIVPAVAPRDDLAPSPALSLIAKAPETLRGRKIGVLVTDGSSAKLLAGLRKAAKKEGARIALVAPRIGGITDDAGAAVAVDMALAGAPSVLFDAVIVAPSADGATTLTGDAAAIDWIRDAYGHLKAIGHVPAASELFGKAGIDLSGDDRAGDDGAGAGGIADVAAARGLAAFLAAARRHRVWDREPSVRPPL
jgi:catalase